MNTSKIHFRFTTSGINPKPISKPVGKDLRKTPLPCVLSLSRDHLSLSSQSHLDFLCGVHEELALGYFTQCCEEWVEKYRQSGCNPTKSQILQKFNTICEKHFEEVEAGKIFPPQLAFSMPNPSSLDLFPQLVVEPDFRMDLFPVNLSRSIGHRKALRQIRRDLKRTCEVVSQIGGHQPSLDALLRPCDWVSDSEVFKRFSQSDQ